MKMEFKTFALKLDGPPDAEGRFTGYAAAFGNVDKGGDVIEAGAFTKTLQENPSVPILWSHDADQPIGISTAMVEDARGLKVEGQLAMEVQRAREVHALMVMGAVKGLSIGYRPMKRSFKGSVRHLQEVALGEFSPTVFPMNDLAAIDGVKRYYDSYDASRGTSALLDMIRTGTDLLVGKIVSGDAASAGVIEGVLGVLAGMLATEVAAVAANATEPDSGLPDDTYMEAMSEPVRHAIKSLEALLDHQPPVGTGDTEDAAPVASNGDTKAEPELVSTLADLTRSLRA